MKQLFKRGVSLLMAALLMLALVGPVHAASSTFTDINDAATAQNVEVLRMMGVIDGMTATTFAPNGTLTRAQFCKMAIEALGKSDQVGIYKNYTIFPDVKSSYWAAGYVNMAVRGETKFITGFSDGTFKPNEVITYGQAVTVLMRLLGYTDADVGVVWPDGYITAAMEIGLTDGVSLSGSSTITRAQAAQLFVNLLNADKKEGGSFLSSIGTPVEDAILLDPNTTDDNGAAAILTSKATYAVAGRTPSSALTGRKGTVLLNESGKAVTFIPTNVGSSKDVTISAASEKEIEDTAGTKYSVNSDTLVYYNNEEGTYGEKQVFLRAGTPATIYTGASGKIEYVVIGTGTSEDAVVVDKNGSTAGFALLTDRTDYKIFKNGEEVGPSALRKYDVATYSSASNTVYVSDNRLTVYYRTAYPNTTAPTRITVTGMSEPLTVLPSASDTLSQYKLGQTITLLLTQDGRVAGVSTDNTARGNTVGYVSGGTVQLFNGLTFDDVPSSAAAEYDGQIVTVSSYGKSSVSLSRLSNRGVSGNLDVAARKVGSTELAGNARIYEKVGNSKMTEISLADLRDDTVSSNKIAYGRRNYAGKIDVLVLDDVTGDLYTYGRIKVRTTTDGETGEKTTETTLEYGAAEPINLGNRGARNGDWAGAVTAAGDGKRIAGYVPLTAIKNVPTTAWRSEEQVYFNNTLYAVADKVACYNKSADVWFDSLGAALAFSDSATLYVDSHNVVRGLEVTQ